MAASHVTISAFLELRDHMSAGVRAVSSEIDRLNRAARDAEDAIRRMRTATRFRPPPPPPPPGRGAPDGLGGRGRGDGARSYIFREVLLANLIADAITKSVGIATDAVTGLIKYTVKVGEEYETAQLRIANTLRSMDLAPSMAVAQKSASGVMTTLRDMAAKLPGEAKDYYNVFAAALPDVLAAGMTDIKKYTDFAGKYAAVAMSRLVDPGQAGRDLQEMLQGRAHLRTKTFQELRSYIGMTAKEYNKLMPERRLELIMSAVQKAGVGMGAAADTANAKFGELKSRLDEIFIIGGQPFFEGVKTAVTEVNKWLEQNKAQIIEITKAVSVGLGDAFNGVLLLVKKIADKVLDLKEMEAPKTKSERLTELEDFYRKRPISESLAGLIPGVGLYRAFTESGEIDRLARETEEDYKRFIAQQATVQSRVGIASLIKPKEYTPSIMEQTVAESRLKELAPIKGVKSMFESQEKWAEFVEARGYDAQRLWSELVKEGKVKPPVAPASVRELNVNFNNNRFDIRQAFAEGFDPDRIAVAFASDLGRLGEFQMQSALAPYASVN